VKLCLVEPAYRVLEQHAPELVARFSAAGVLAFVSPYVRALLGEPPNALLGSSLFSLIAREDRAEVQRRLKVLESPGNVREECRVHLIDAYGQLVSVQLALYALRVTPERSPSEYVMVARELEGAARLVMARALSGQRPLTMFSEAPSTGARPSPEQLGRRDQQISALVARAGLCHLRLDPQGRVLLIDAAALALLGYDQPAQLVGKNAQRHLWRGPLALSDALAHAQRDGSTRFEAPLRCRDGTLRSVECVFEPMRGDDDAALAIDVLLRDVTEERREAWEREHAREAADAGSRAKSAFLASMSHEIRTPMNAILGMTHLALEADSLARTREYLARIQVAGAGLLDVINDILDVSKIEAGKLELELAPFELDRMIDTVATVIAVRSAERKLELVLAIDPALPEVLVGDRARLTQVLLNLAGNAVKFTDRGEIVVQLDLVSRSEGRAELRCAVRDSGIGMSSEQLARLFQPFSQLESANKRDRGTGLGLVIAQELVRCMGGEIEVESTPGLGSEFRFTLQLEVPEPSQPARARIAPELRDWRVLVVESVEATRVALERSLLALGFTVCTVATDQEGLRALNQSERGFELVLIDAQHLDAARKIALLREHRPELVMLSTQPREEVDGDLSFARAFLRKPVSRASLIDCVLDAADARRNGPRSAPPPALVAQPRPKPLAGLSLLVVEDNEINQILARDLLETAGATVLIASDGHEAIRLCAARAFDLILMDVQMPGLDGHATTRVLRAEAKTADTPIIAMTAHAFDAERKKCLASGMNAHVSKPISPPELVQTVLTWATPKAVERARALRPSPVPSIDVPEPEERPSVLEREDVLRAFEQPAISARPPHVTLSPEPTVKVDRYAPTTPAPPAAFDPDALAAVFKDPARRLTFLRKFVDSAHATLRELHGAWERHAEADISFAGHKLKSSAKACGAHALAALCADLEHHAKDGDWEKLRPLEGRAEQLLADVTRHVEALEARAR
jgi:signal transduction histidine kinase/CheY-like chemotaxis protein/HPt (histidine-containing phosphotransfer) domain-containing protein